MPARFFFPLLLALLLSSPLPRAEAEIKNVLYLISDDLKTSTLGCYGNPISKTPNIDQLARSSMRFTRAYCQSMHCRPSRISIMSSRYKDRKPGQHLTFPQHFKNHGWRTARFSKIFHMPISRSIERGDSGEDHPESWTEFYNFKAPEAFTPGAYACLNKNIFTREIDGREGAGQPNRMFVTVEMDGDGSDQPDYMAARDAVEWLKKNKGSPFLLAVGMVRPHYPMVAPKKYFDLYPYETMRPPYTPEGDWDDIPKAGISGSNSQANGLAQYPDNIKRMHSGYLASVSFMDTQVGKVLAAIAELGLKKNTAIVFTSDHGYHLGEHHFWQKTNLHEQVTNVPLLISAPGFSPGVSSSLAELADIFPTLAELAGLPIPDSCHGLSLVPVLRDPSRKIRKHAFSYQKNHHTLRGERWAYMSYGENGSEGEELYDMEKDPDQFTNLAGSPDHKEVLLQFRQSLRTKLEKIGQAGK